MRFYRSLEFIQDNIVLWHVRNWTITDCAILVAKAPKGPKVGESSCETWKRGILTPWRPERDSNMKLVPSECVFDTELVLK